MKTNKTKWCQNGNPEVATIYQQFSLSRRIHTSIEDLPAKANDVQSARTIPTLLKSFIVCETRTIIVR
jgi:hypothetical protein